MSSTATSSAFSKANAHALSFFSTSGASSPFGGTTFLDSHGFLKSSHRAGGPTLCSLPALVTRSLLLGIRQICPKAEGRAKDILEQLSLEFISIELVGRLSKVNPEAEPNLTILVVMPDQPNPDIWYQAVRRIQSELEGDLPGVSVELIEEKLYTKIYCSPVDSTHTILPKWYSIVKHILSHCDTRQWTSLECWRYGTDKVRERNPVTVIVQVRETSRNPLITTARDIHEILTLFNEADVDVLFQTNTNTLLI
ncbi:unnamed protein product [Penicillium camemberti]|uniref:Str. FM013 n=1 Tax=Penicillium camemberti (strain FM 013) TaxID=1429867 RepID=A0A0G4PC12_PENC3|nr:unnamed protein product [Penicillium camemberti]